MSLNPATPTPKPLQPLLHDEVVALRAPTQYWAGKAGEVGTEAIHGVYHGDVRHVREITLTYDGHRPEHIGLARQSSSLEFTSLLRHIDDDEADPKVVLHRNIGVTDGKVGETLTVTSHVNFEIQTRISVRITPDFASMQELKSGMISPRSWDFQSISPTAVRCVAGEGKASFELTATEGEIIMDGDAFVVNFPLTVTPRGQAEAGWSLSLDDPTLVVRGPQAGEQSWQVGDITTAIAADGRIDKWLEVALADLDALRLALPNAPEDEFFAAGAPWFFTLFGRDSIWAARLALSLKPRQAAATLRVLARLQSDQFDAATAAAPGKIMHELRSEPLAIPGENMLLPPIYYGTVDATALWVCLLAETYQIGAMTRAELVELLPNLRAALTWITQYGDSDGDGFLDYIDETGHGLANQGWKDSGDAIQWRTGELARGPLALCEVQGYAYEAAVLGAELLDELGESGAENLRAWAQELKERFANQFWVTTEEGTYPAIALDVEKRPVDTLTSNIGHLLGTGILEPEQEEQIAQLLTGPSMLSGYGVRTLSTEASGFWPLSYHGGSVWAHDTAIIARAMARAGLQEYARKLVDNLIDLAEGFEYRVPELNGGDAKGPGKSAPIAYPAACRPQAWSAAAAVVCLEVLGEGFVGTEKPKLT